MSDKFKKETKSRSTNKEESSISFKRLSKTFLISYLLGWGKTAEAGRDLDIKSSLLDKNTQTPTSSYDLICPSNFFFNPKYQVAKPITPWITDQFIGQFIVGTSSSNQHQKIIDILQKARLINSETAKTIDFVLTHLSGFSIACHNTESIKEANSAASFSPHTKTILINIDELSSPVMLTILIHEFRHAWWNAILRANNQGSKLSVNPYLTDTEKTELESMFAKGDQRLKELENQLRQEEILSEQAKSGAISSENSEKLQKLRKYLLKLRKSSNKEYNQYYKTSTDPDNKVVLYESYVKALGGELKIGSTFYLLDYGRVTIKKIYDRPQSGTKRADLTFEDPLYGIVYRLKWDLNFIKKSYSKDQQLSEREAYLFSHCDRNLRRAIYSEVVWHTDRIMKEANDFLPMQKQEVLDYLSVGELNWQSLLLTLKDPDDYLPTQIPNYLGWVEKAANKGEFDAAESGLKKLIAHDDHVTEAKSKLSEIQAKKNEQRRLAEKAGISQEEVDSEKECRNPGLKG